MVRSDFWLSAISGAAALATATALIVSAAMLRDPGVLIGVAGSAMWAYASWRWGMLAIDAVVDDDVKRWQRKGGQ